MGHEVSVEAARIPDRDRLLRELRDAGLDAKPDGEVGIVVACGDQPDAVRDDVYARVERMVMSVGSTFVPIKHDDVIYIRPPVG